MSDFQQTTFKFTTNDETPLSITCVMTYAADNSWVPMPEGKPVQGGQNQGIQYLHIPNSEISQAANGIVSVQIDPKIVNNVPYASDKASLLISVNGSNLHIDIHSNGGMKTTGTFGNKSVKFDCNFGNVGGDISVIDCTSA